MKRFAWVVGMTLATHASAAPVLSALAMMRAATEITEVQATPGRAGDYRPVDEFRNYGSALRVWN